MIEIIDKLGIEMFMGSDSAILDQIALLLTNAYVWIPMYLALFVLIIKNNDNMQQILLTLCFIAVLIFLASGVANLLVKPLVERLRPCNDPQFKCFCQIAGDMHENSFSFFSSHAANTMSVATFFTLLVRSRLLSITLYFWSFVNMWTRLYLGQHFFTDILAGMVWGIVVAFAVYALYRGLFRKLSSGNKFVSTQYTETGFSYLDVDVVVSVFMLTVCISVIPMFINF